MKIRFTSVAARALGSALPPVTAWLVAAACMPAVATAAPAAPAFACNRDSTLTLVGLDSAAGRALFTSPPAREHEPFWLVELDAGAGSPTSARYRSLAAGPRPFAGSLGPGPIFAALRCGDGCLQPVRYAPGREGESAWRPLGPPLAGDGAAVHTTYDRSGRPWVVLHRPVANDPAALEATAYRLTVAASDGDERWEPRGSLTVRAAGTVGAAPDPQRDDAVLSGTGRFSASAPPQSWIRSLPKLPEDRRGELVATGTGDGAALLDTSYGLYTTADGGESWQRQRWAPWGSPKAQLWEPGRDYWLDLPAYDRSGPLALAWFDRRKREEHRLILTSWQAGTGWRTVASLPPETRTLDGVALVFDHILHPASDRWVLLTGCVLTASGPGVGLRTVTSGEASSPSFLPLRPASR